MPRLRAHVIFVLGLMLLSPPSGAATGTVVCVHAEFGQKVAAMLDGLVRRQGLTNIMLYCMAIELSVAGRGWASLGGQRPTFKDYPQKIHDALAGKKLGIGLLALDLGLNPQKLAWARENMDEITSAYGGHVYFRHAPNEAHFYDDFLTSCWKAVAVGAPKPFVVGEFGASQFVSGGKDGFKRWDGCRWWDTPAERYVAL
jgi:hypothetical protein